MQSSVNLNHRMDVCDVTNGPDFTVTIPVVRLFCPIIVIVVIDVFSFTYLLVTLMLCRQSNEVKALEIAEKLPRYK